jgi:Helix-turn-helix domain
MHFNPSGEPSSLEQPASPEQEPGRAYRISDVCKLTGLGRTSIYAAIKSGRLVARKWNRCTIVLGDDLATFLNNLPTTR